MITALFAEEGHYSVQLIYPILAHAFTDRAEINSGSGSISCQSHQQDDLDVKASR